MIVIGYDGSPDSQAAVKHAGALMPGQPATVLSVWEAFTDVMNRVGAATWLDQQSLDEINGASERSARTRAEQGAELAQAAGLRPQVRVVMRATTIAETILLVADDVGADAIVLGTRGLGGVRSLLLGSVSHAVLQHADRAVMVVPSAEVAARRAAGRR